MVQRASTIKKLTLLVIPAVILFMGTGCSTSNRGTVSQTDLNNRTDQTFSFNNDENGSSVRWEVNFDDGEITSLYKDGERVPDNEIDDYKDMIYHRLDRLHKKSRHISIDLGDFKSDMGNFKHDMQKMKEELKNNKYEFNFDNDEFREGMEKLSEELSKLKDKKIRIDFDSDKFREEMENLNKELDVHVDIDMDNIDKNLDKINDEMDKRRGELSHISIDLTGLDEAMAHLDENLGDLKVNLNGLDLKIKKLNEFIDQIKKEMVKDNLLRDESDKLNLDLDENGMKVNGKEVPSDLYKKYKKMYEDHFGKKLSDDNSFRIID
ncbi:MAG TPA: hypothetical protein VKD08_03780 [Ignavibacteriaceae bacterium]|nr:hypothetical protein [Ignavibacteriaceae bacterium]